VLKTGVLDAQILEEHVAVQLQLQQGICSWSNSACRSRSSLTAPHPSPLHAAPAGFDQALPKAASGRFAEACLTAKQTPLPFRFHGVHVLVGCLVVLIASAQSIQLLVPR